jgi:hypothetical protein
MPRTLIGSRRSRPSSSTRLLSTSRWAFPTWVSLRSLTSPATSFLELPIRIRAPIYTTTIVQLLASRTLHPTAAFTRIRSLTLHSCCRVYDDTLLLSDALRDLQEGDERHGIAFLSSVASRSTGGGDGGWGSAVGGVLGWHAKLSERRGWVEGGQIRGGQRCLGGRRRAGHLGGGREGGCCQGGDSGVVG